LTETRVIPALVVGAAAFAGVLIAGDDPFVGTWKLNPAKSTYFPGPAPQGPPGMFKYELNPGGGLRVTVIGFTPEGKADDHVRVETYDGTPHPVVGDRGADAIAARRPTPYVIEGENSKLGKPPLYFFRAVSADGQTLTVTFDSMNPNGERTAHNVRVYDKQ